MITKHLPLQLKSEYQAVWRGHMQDLQVKQQEHFHKKLIFHKYLTFFFVFVVDPANNRPILFFFFTIKTAEYTADTRRVKKVLTIYIYKNIHCSIPSKRNGKTLWVLWVELASLCEGQFLTVIYWSNQTSCGEHKTGGEKRQQACKTKERKKSATTKQHTFYFSCLFFCTVWGVNTFLYCRCIKEQTCPQTNSSFFPIFLCLLSI